jgi:hypothetical protein
LRRRERGKCDDLDKTRNHNLYSKTNLIMHLNDKFLIESYIFWKYNKPQLQTSEQLSE